MASVAESLKRAKYAGLLGGYTFYPVASETLSACGGDAQTLVSELGGRLCAVTGDVRSTAILRQRLDLAIQRGNAEALRGTLPDGSLATH